MVGKSQMQVLPLFGITYKELLLVLFQNPQKFQLLIKSKLFSLVFKLYPQQAKICIFNQFLILNFSPGNIANYLFYILIPVIVQTSLSQYIFKSYLSIKLQVQE